MEKVLVTGGAGYIGSHFCKELFRKGNYPIVADNLIYGYKENVKWGELYVCDIGDYGSIDRCFKEHKIEAVVHFAAFAYVGESVTNPMRYYENNLKNTITLLTCMLNNKVKKIVFSSSCATYGIPDKIPIDEQHKQEPINPYGQTKLMIEKMLRDYDRAYGLKYAILRYFNAAGSDPDGELGEQHVPETHLIPLVLDVALGRRNCIKIFGDDYETKDGTCIRDYIHVTDLANAHINALQMLQNGHNSDFYNLGAGVGYSVKDVIHNALKITGKNIRCEIDKRREGDPPILIASNEKAIKKLDWKIQYSCLDEILRTAWRFHENS
jgi:UDP-glucose 4-epimerase